MGLTLDLQAISDELISEFSRSEQKLQSFVEHATRRRDIRLWPSLALSPHLDLDKSWHGLHFLFTKSAWQGDEPYCYLLSKGTKIGLYNGEFEVRAISSKELAAFESAVSEFDRAEVTRRYDVKAMAEQDIYILGTWENADNVIDYLCEKICLLKAFLTAAKARGEGALIVLS